MPIPGEAAAYTHRTQRGTSGERSVIPSPLPSRYSAGYFVVGAAQPTLNDYRSVLGVSLVAESVPTCSPI